MVASLAARWLLTVAFAAAAVATVAAALPGREAGGPARRADRGAAVFCLAMCAALIVMAWWPEPAAAAWAQAAGFGCAAIALAASRRARPGLDRLHHALMAVAMAWMLVALPAAMAAMPSAGLPVPVLVLTGLVAACCAAASIPWLARAVGPGPRVKSLAAVGQAVMGAAMAAMLIVMM